MEWTTGVLSPQSDNPHDRETHMRSVRIGTPAEFIAPEATPGLLLEMKPLDMLLTNQHIRSHTSKTPLNHPTEPAYGISIKISRSIRDNLEIALNITYRRTILITSFTSTYTTSITHSWFSALDPSSYPSTRDEMGNRQWDGLGCWKNKNCVNYVGYFDRPGLKRAVDWFREWERKERERKGKGETISDLEVCRERRLRGGTAVQTAEAQGAADWIRNNQMAWERIQRKRVERGQRRRKYPDSEEIKMGDQKGDDSRSNDSWFIGFIGFIGSSLLVIGRNPKLPVNLTKEISKGKKTWWGKIGSLFKLVKENAGAQVHATKAPVSAIPPPKKTKDATHR
ncbi:hypothetical protein B0T16DRAFT_456620 [Cercophora newfieldiana]|uniref:Uncharacterized protein n=1 Tax=Cercophora newfieldiana TaxID=92897 RepID=A0AA40CU83_9PEZI|nr:hypothetical protein B0T16DRAFT_456620 [Cercophora newfieldiana]